MAERSGTFRVYRVVESVPHINLQAVGSPTLYTVYQSGYGDLQPSIDDLRTGDRIEATIEGDPGADADPWRLTALERLDRIEVGFAVGATPPDVAREAWEPGATEPIYAAMTAGGEPAGVCCLQPRAPLPDEPDASAHSEPYGVLLLFPAAGRELADRFRERYDCPRGTDTRPAFDPYGI